MANKSWICTLNNPIITLESIWDAEIMTFMVGQLEMGENGTPHFQFCITFKTTKRISYFKKLNKDIHAEIPNNLVASRKYC